MDENDQETSYQQLQRFLTSPLASWVSLVPLYIVYTVYLIIPTVSARYFTFRGLSPLVPRHLSTYLGVYLYIYCRSTECRRAGFHGDGQGLRKAGMLRIIKNTMFRPPAQLVFCSLIRGNTEKVYRQFIYLFIYLATFL